MGACCLQVKDAMSAVALLHNHVLQQEDAPGATAKGKGNGKPKEAPAAPEGLLLWARQVSGEGAHLKKWRLILRNLPFNVRSVHLCYVHCAAVTCVRGYKISQSVSLRSSVVWQLSGICTHLSWWSSGLQSLVPPQFIFGVHYLVL